MKYTKTLLIALFLAAFLIRVLFAYATPIKIWDETVYLNLGTDLSHNLLDYSFSHGWSDYIPSARNDAYGYPNAGFRAPLLPYIIAFLHIFNVSFLISYLMPLIGALSVIVIYFLGKELFSKRIGMIAAAFFTFLPLHAEYSGRVLTDILLTFFVLLSFLSFWKGFEKGDNRHKILFGVFLALSLLARYTALWIFPVFLIYVIVSGRLLQFLRDKYMWFAIAAFLITLIPLFIYGYSAYNNPLGAIIHGTLASGYWGGIQSWHFFFDYWWQMFSVVGFIFAIALGYLAYKKDFLKKEVYLLLIWFTFFLGIALCMPHKEGRFILPIVATIVLIAAYSIDKIKNYKNAVMFGSLGILLFSVSTSVYTVYSADNNINASCFQQVGAKLKEVKGDFLIVSENSSLFRYYAEQENVFYPGEINENTIKDLTNSTDKKILFVFTKYNSGFEGEKWKNLHTLMKKNYDLVYTCERDKEVNWIYLKADTSALQNLIPNNSFEIDGDNSWVTNTAKYVTVESNNKGSAPSPLKSAKITGSSEDADFHTALIPVELDSQYEFKVYTDTKEMQSGELGFLIDEYTDSNEWIRATWVGNATPQTKGYVAALYTPGSASVRAIRIQTYLQKNTKGTVYLDNYQLYKIN